MTNVFSRGAKNAITVALIWLPRVRRRELYCGPVDLMLALLVVIAAMIAGGLVLYDYVGVNYTFTLGGNILVYMTAALIGLMLVGRAALSGEVAVGLLWAMAFGSVLTTLMARDVELQHFPNWATYGMIPFLVPGCLFLLFRLGTLRGALVSLAFILPGAAFVGEWMMMNFLQQVRSTETSEQTYVPPDTEMIYAAQPALLARQTGRLRAGDPDHIELFAVLGAGYAYEGVFRREVEAVGQLLEHDFAARDRVIRLVNDDDDVASYPLMNRVNFGASLKELGAKMDPDDIAMIFLTSHGSPGGFSTSQYGVITRDITPEDVATAIDGAGIGNAVVIVSACYSGSFVEKLEAPDRLVITASAGDRNSFGCSDKNEWTDWGRAFFTEALAETADPRKAAARAQEIVAERENQLGYTPSNPQIAEGAEIGSALDRWLADLEVWRQTGEMAGSAVAPISPSDEAEPQTDG